MQLKAIDVSAWQHPNGAAIDWPQVRASGVTGVVIKATQGVWYRNPDFHADAAAAAAAGLVVGAYHFAGVLHDGAAQEAAYFHAAVQGVACPLGYWLDLETTGGLAWFDLGAWMDEWLTAVHTPVTPAGAYLNLDFANQLLTVHPVPRLWLANPSGDANPYAPFMIQTGTGPVAGIVGAVDLDVIPNARSINPTPGDPGAPGPNPNPTDTEEDEMVIHACEGKATVLEAGSKFIGLDQAELDEAVANGVPVKHWSADLYDKITAPA